MFSVCRPCVRIFCVRPFFVYFLPVRAFFLCALCLSLFCVLSDCVFSVYRLSVCCLPVIFDSCKIILPSNQAALTIDNQKTDR